MLSEDDPLFQYLVQTRISGDAGAFSADGRYGRLPVIFVLCQQNPRWLIKPTSIIYFGLQFIVSKIKSLKL